MGTKMIASQFILAGRTYIWPRKLYEDVLRPAVEEGRRANRRKQQGKQGEGQ